MLIRDYYKNLSDMLQTPDAMNTEQAKTAAEAILSCSSEGQNHAEEKSLTLFKRRLLEALIISVWAEKEIGEEVTAQELADRVKEGMHRIFYNGTTSYGITVTEILNVLRFDKERYHVAIADMYIALLEILEAKQLLDDYTEKEGEANA